MTKRWKLTWQKSVNLIIVLGALALFSCKSKINLDLDGPAMDRALPDETSYGVRITELNGKEIDYVLVADKIERYYDRKILNGWKVQITSYDKAGNTSTTIKADTTIVDDARNIIFANGNVYLESPGGTISTSRMIWDRNVDEIIAPDRVVLTRYGNVLKGTNLRTNTSLSFAEMSSVEAEGMFGNEEIIDW